VALRVRTAPRRTRSLSLAIAFPRLAAWIGIVLAAVPFAGCAPGVADEQTSFSKVPHVTNVLPLGTIHSGFLVGNISGNSPAGLTFQSVQVSLDGGSFAPATGVNPWSFALPKGSATWAKGTTHNVQLQGISSTGLTVNGATFSIVKGTNQDQDGDGYPDLVVGAMQTSPGFGYAQLYPGSASGIRLSSALHVPGPAATLQFGSTLGFGDFNGDGYGDVAVGSTSGGSGGAAYIFNGGPGGLSTVPNVTMTVSGSNLLGQAIVVADFNLDGYDDLACGDWNTGASDNGGAYVFNGAAGGPAATPSVSINAAATSSNFGLRIAAGDIDEDGFPDLIVGGNGGGASAGLWVYPGSATGLSALTGTQVVGPVGNGYGSSITIGDFNGDGHVDVAVGVTSIGDVNIYYGNGAIIGLANTPVVLTGNSADTFGVNLAAGDINGDGISDLLVGATTAAIANAGEVFIYLGTSMGLPATADYTLSGTGSVNLGGGMAVVDGQGSGFPDVFVGASGGAAGFAGGGAYVYPNTAGVLNTTVVTSPFDGSGTTGDAFGASISD
jgi:FG-GAP-like repeat/FG-GAP repeat